MRCATFSRPRTIPDCHRGPACSLSCANKPMSPSTSQSSKKRDIAVVTFVGIVAMMLGVSLFMLVDDRDRGQLTGEPAPSFELPVMEQQDETVALADLEGKVVLMDFWATWCPPCREQMPQLERIAEDEELSDHVAVLSINTDPQTDDRHERIEQFLEEEQLSLPTLLDSGRVQSAYGAGTIPTLVVIDPHGNINYVGEGVHDEQRLRELIDEADS